MKFVLTTGGTAGHINPAIALAEELCDRGHNVLFAGTPNRLESKLIPNEGYAFRGFKAVGFNRRHPLTLIKAINSIIKSTKEAKKWLEDEKPDAVVGFGCYVSLAICRAAMKLNIPVVIHEQNSVMGMANKYLSKRVNATCLTYEHADTGKCREVILTGNPVRKKFFKTTKEEGRKLLNIPLDAKMLLVFGGSLGAKHINEAIYKMKDKILEDKNFYIVHITGKDTYDSEDRYQVLEYQDRMAETMAAADKCISRAGASSLAEITAMKLPSLLIPYPLATENHQFYNAQSLIDSGCAMYMSDENIGKPEFENAVFKLLEDEDMAIAFKDIDARESVKKLADVVCGIVV
ncbi:MAG: undecaprenyldiphospho-muramoylpentapeptide beta-N-acetylglucosaminyltransferase [Coriobacteriia bacterium]|nr:undecaprenyldiphospho-muramoylpentapeptide beta-N-acetylglucosaminyltransferase [Coriobacteriia bacterium]